MTLRERQTSRLKPIYDLWKWQEEGLCRKRNIDPNVFFFEDSMRGKVKRSKEKEAKKICQACPVIQQCLEHSLNLPENYGIWGGMTEEERRRVIRKKRRL
jgi:WhiB family redox-sensing transcriptional regulator